MTLLVRNSTLISAPDSYIQSLGSLIALGIWNVVEISVGIVCASLPSMRPLLRLLVSGSFYPSTGHYSGGTSDQKFWRSSKIASHSRKASFTRLNELDGAKDSKNDGQNISIGTGSETEMIEMEEGIMSKENIYVKKTIKQTIE